MPYLGSKNTIAETIVKMLPRADVLVDVFAGGCAITHAALLSRRWSRIIANDITDTVNLFKRLITDGVPTEQYRAVSRDEFFLLKDSDPIVRYAWSYGNDGRSYLWSRDTEFIRLQAVRMLTAPTVSQRRLEYLKFIRLLADLQCPESPESSERLERLERLQSLERLERLQSLQSLESLQRMERLRSPESLERLQSLEVMQGDYRNVTIPDGAVVYCDPPYRETASYLTKFNHDEFYDWVKSTAKNHPIFVSEYLMPDCFTCVFETSKRSLLASNGNCQLVTERLYTYGDWQLDTPYDRQLSLFN